MANGSSELGDFAVDVVGEVVFAVVACVLGVGALAAVAWGWRRDVPATVLLIAALIAFAAYGVWQLFISRREGPVRGRLAVAAGAFAIAVAVWISYVLVYCTCVG